MELEAEQNLLLRLETLTDSWPGGEARNTGDWLEGLAEGDAAESRDALLVLRIAANLSVDQA